MSRSHTRSSVASSQPAPSVDARNPFLSSADSYADDRASYASDISDTSDVALHNLSRDSYRPTSTVRDSGAHTPYFDASGREIVYSSQSSAMSSHSNSSSIAGLGSEYDRYPPRSSRMTLSNYPVASSRASSASMLGGSGMSTSSDPDFSPFGGYPVSSFPLHIEETEADDYMHNPDPVLDAKLDAACHRLDTRGALNLCSLSIMFFGAIAVFVILPVLTFTGKAGSGGGTVTKYIELTDYTYPILAAVRTSLIDPDTPSDARTRLDKDGNTMNLVFSDEFNQVGRTFYPGDDQFWEAVNIHYAATQDLEWYEPDAVTTRDGALILRMDAFKNHDLDYRSGMMQSWNKLCFTGGYIEISASLPGRGDKMGFWPGLWTMGNLGRPGYMATTDGVWPYSYDECDGGITPNQSSTDGISYLPGQRLNACTCSGEDHPSPGTGRGAPEIDIIEGSVASYNTTTKAGIASQSLQTAPFDVWYYPNYDFIEINNHNLTEMNTYTGGPFQQAISAVTVLNPEWYDGANFQKYAIEYAPGTEDGYTRWFVGDDWTYTLYGKALGPNGNIGARPISKEPMSIIMNFGLSTSWVYIDWNELEFPSEMAIDYVRIYQKEGNESLTCDPEGYPTTTYISEHANAYANFNLTKWHTAGYTNPKNSLMDGC
ncbi:beta-glucan synthesis-associated protein KRE6 [Dipodascopsis tothii]|uniref:beta-glucan synthesis-associated protein KRE6 n=1 Tax=Dipodascopsis tothii TaxID=44089 RepID=UPI0034CEF798